jgi:hypothetical protein
VVQWRAAEDATCCPHFPRRRQPRAVARPKQQQQEACWRDGAEGFLCLPAPQTPPSPGGERLAAADPCVGPGGGCFERWCSGAPASASVCQRLFQKASLQAGGARRIRARTQRSHRPARRRRFHDLGLDWVSLFWGVGSRILGRR